MSGWRVKMPAAKPVSLLLLIMLVSTVFADEAADVAVVEELPEGLFEFLGESDSIDEVWLDGELWADAMGSNRSTGDE